MTWYKQSWRARCPVCNKVWDVEQGKAGWIAARDTRLKARSYDEMAAVKCDECLRKPKP